jgi:hypothetical protein
MDHFVTLERLPEGLRFPADLADRVGYDAERKRLWYRGWMCKAEYDRLFLLSQDWTYRRQLEELFRLSMPEDRRPARGRVAMVAAAGVGLTLALAAAWWWGRDLLPGAAHSEAPASQVAGR